MREYESTSGSCNESGFIGLKRKIGPRIGARERRAAAEPFRVVVARGDDVVGAAVARDAVANDQAQGRIDFDAAAGIERDVVAVDAIALAGRMDGGAAVVAAGVRDDGTLIRREDAVAAVARGDA